MCVPYGWGKVKGVWNLNSISTILLYNIIIYIALKYASFLRACVRMVYGTNHKYIYIYICRHCTLRLSFIRYRNAVQIVHLCTRAALSCPPPREKKNEMSTIFEWWCINTYAFSLATYTFYLLLFYFVFHSSIAVLLLSLLLYDIQLKRVQLSIGYK